MRYELFNTNIQEADAELVGGAGVLAGFIFPTEFNRRKIVVDRSVE